MPPKKAIVVRETSKLTILVDVSNDPVGNIIIAHCIVSISLIVVGLRFHWVKIGPLLEEIQVENGTIIYSQSN